MLSEDTGGEHIEQVDREGERDHVMQSADSVGEHIDQADREGGGNHVMLSAPPASALHLEAER